MAYSLSMENSRRTGHVDTIRSRLPAAQNSRPGPARFLDAYGGVDTSSSPVANVVSPCFSTAVTVPPVPVHRCTAIVLTNEAPPGDTGID